MLKSGSNISRLFLCIALKNVRLQNCLSNITGRVFVSSISPIRPRLCENGRFSSKDVAVASSLNVENNHFSIIL